VSLSGFFSHRILQVEPSPTLRIAAEAQALKAAGHDVINLSLGEPDAVTPSLSSREVLRVSNREIRDIPP